jgi:FkbM family methyltransferase
VSGGWRRLARVLPRSWRNWLRSPAATLNWAWDDLRHRGGADVVAELRPGWKIRCHPAAWRMAYRVHQEDEEQARELDSFIRSCSAGMVLFDLGAHFGLFSLAAVHYGGDAARAVAVEPSDFAGRMIREEARLNGCGDAITLVTAAIAEIPGRVEMIPVGVIAAGYFSAADDAHGAGERHEVRAATVDELARELSAWPTHIKIDVEGAEGAALRGARLALDRHPAPTLFVELHNRMIRDRGGDPAESLEVLEQMGYRIYGLDEKLLDRAAILSRDLLRVVARRERRRTS